MFKLLKLRWKLHSRNSYIGRAAAEALGKLGDKRAIRPLIKALDDGCLRHEAAKALVTLGPCTVEPLIQALADGKSEVRAVAAWALGKLSDIRAVEPLVGGLGGWDSDVHRTAAEALGNLGDRRAVEPLIKVLGDGKRHVRQAAAEALDKLGEPKWKEIIQGDKEDWARLGACGDSRAVEPLIRVLGDRLSMHGDDHRAAKDALVALGQCAVGPLIKALSVAGSGVFAAVAEVLGKLGDTSAVEPLITVLNARDSGGRLAAAEALGKLGDKRAVEPLINTLHPGDQATFEALAKLGDVRAIKPLIIAMGFPDARIHDAAARALASFGRCAVEPLIEALRNEHKLDHSAAAEALGELGDIRAVEPLITVLSDLYSGSRLAAAEALGKLGDSRAVEPLIRALGDCRRTAAEALYKLDERKWQDIIKGDNDDWSRLASCDDPRAVEPLIEALDKKQSWDVRRAAAEALAKAASVTPSVIGKRWNQIRELVMEPHHDYSTSCGDHGDSGIGVDFPPPPSGLDF
jgi:HEAT repeat protein